VALATAAAAAALLAQQDLQVAVVVVVVPLFCLKMARQWLWPVVEVEVEVLAIVESVEATQPLVLMVKLLKESVQDKTVKVIPAMAVALAEVAAV
jgi:hypothetical protein